jgi:hypothetical protein
MSIIFNFYKIKYLIFIKKVLFEILMTIISKELKKLFITTTFNLHIRTGIYKANILFFIFINIIH